MVSPPPMLPSLQASPSPRTGHSELPELVKVEVAQGGVRLDVILLVQTALDSELQFMGTVNLAQHCTQLTGVLSLLVIAIRVVPLCWESPPQSNRRGTSAEPH